MSGETRVDDSEFQRWLVKYQVETGKGLREILREEGGLLAKEAMRLTPPTWGGQKTFGKQKAAGVMAVKRDLARVYMPISQVQKEAKLRTDADGARVFFRLLNRDVPAALQWMRDAGMPSELIEAVQRGVRSFDDGAEHRRRRNSRGRVRGDRPFVVRGAGLPAYRRERLARVLTLKAGWYRSAVGLPLKGIPSSITKAAGYSKGTRVDRTGSQSDPYLTLSNRVRYSGTVDGEVRFGKMALRNRQKVFAKKVERVVKSGWRAR